MMSGTTFPLELIFVRVVEAPTPTRAADNPGASQPPLDAGYQCGSSILSTSYNYEFRWIYLSASASTATDIHV
jgi:hypothetical protein